MNGHHPQHGAITAAVREWYTRSYPEMGYFVERWPFGWYMRHATAGFGAVTVAGVRPEQVPALLADVAAYYGDCPASVLVDDRDADAVLGPALVAAGCMPGPAQIFIAQVGPLPVARPVEGLTLEPLTSANMRDWVLTKLQGFASSDAEPDEARVQHETLLREAELAGEGRFLLARFRGERAAIIAWYEGEDRHLFLLATLVPFRNRGIARLLLCHVLDEAAQLGCRSVVIACDPDDTPIQLYRRLGFTDEVGWRRPYALPR